MNKPTFLEPVQASIKEVEGLLRSQVGVENHTDLRAALEHLLAGRTSLIIAHRLSTVRKATSIAVVDQGRIAELGNHEALLRSGGLYAKLWSIQSEHGEIQTIEGLFQKG